MRCLHTSLGVLPKIAAGLNSRFLLTIALSVCLPVLLSAVADAHGEHKSNSTATSTTVPQARVNSEMANVEIVDGTDIRFERLSTSNGSLQTKIAQIVQDDQGFLWFRTPHGLQRYDGYNLKILAHDLKDPNSLSCVPVGALFNDRLGTIWVGCDQFLNRFDKTTETFARYPIKFVRHISQDSTGILWLSTPTGLYELDSMTGRIHRYSHDPDDPWSLSDNDIASTGEDKEGRFWVASVRGLDDFDRETGKVRLHIPLLEPSHEISFYEDRSGVFWIFHTSGNALAVFDSKTNTLTHYSFHDQRPHSTPLTGVTAMLEDQNGTLWLATHGAGLLKFERDLRRFIRYRYNAAKHDSLPQNNVESLFADQEGSVWAGLGRMGVARFDTRPLPFHDFPYLDSPKTTVEPFVGAIYEDPQGIVWIGTPAALNRIDRSGHYTYYRRAAGPAAGMDVIAIREGRSGELWVGTYGHGLLRLDQQTGQFKVYRHNPKDPHSLSSDIVSRLLVDHNGTLWATTSEGLDRFDAPTERFTVQKPDPQGHNIFYLELVEDQEGALWLGGESTGLQRFDPATGEFTLYQHDVDGFDSLSDNRVNSLYFDHSGALWVGTQNGLDKFDPKTGKFIVYTVRDGLPGNTVACVLEDDQGNLWMSTDNGVARLNSQRKTFTSYSPADGLPGRDFTGWGTCSGGSSGKMFFGGYSGATVFSPDEVRDTSYAPPIVLIDFRLYGNLVEIGPRSPLKKSITYTSDLTLSHEQNVFSLAFAALSFTNPAANRYRYKLEGLDRGWNEVGSDARQASYTTLPAGRYTFRAQGATASGPWSKPGLALRIQILPPMWETLWFKATCSSLVLLAGFAAYRYRAHQIRKAISIRFDERLAERTRVARELHDTLLQSFHGVLFRFQSARNMLPRRPDQAIEALDAAILRTEQAIAEGRTAIKDLRSESTTQGDLGEFLRGTGDELFASRAEEVDAPLFRVVVEGECRTLFPILQDEVCRIGKEVLRNAFKHASARHIEAEIRYDNQFFRLRIRDDGKGIDPKILQDANRPGHWGLQGVRERAQRIGAKLEFWSETEMGTEVQLTVPAALAYEIPSETTGFRLFRKARIYERRS